MFDTLKRLWDDGLLTEPMLRNAVTKGWITAQEYTTLSGIEWEVDHEPS